MEHVEAMLKAVSEDLAGVATGDAVVGSAVKLGEATVYPISMISMGLGSGGGEGETTSPGAGNAEKGVGGGAGGGAKARPVAVIVVTAAGVKVLPLPQRRGPFERLLDKIPELVGKVKEAVE
jgi:uncharacterized spore protein YtfJ